jgi:predicted RNase H-like HicB family nuclease
VIRVGLARPAPRSDEPFEAWVLDLLGCVALGGSEPAALEQVDDAIDAYLRHARDLGAVAPRGDVRVVERFECWWAGEHEVSAFFRHVDLAPVVDDEAVFAARLLERTRAALLAAAERDRDADAVLRHVAESEWFYATRFDEAPPELAGLDVRDVEDLLDESRAVALRRIAALPRLGTLVRRHREEQWTPRKMLRRVLQHEFDHVLALERRASATPPEFVFEEEAGQIREGEPGVR